jgi:hypothetical protein
MSDPVFLLRRVFPDQRVFKARLARVKGVIARVRCAIARVRACQRVSVRLDFIERVARVCHSLQPTSNLTTSETCVSLLYRISYCCANKLIVRYREEFDYKVTGSESFTSCFNIASKG